MESSIEDIFEDVNVLFRFSKKTGKIDTTMTGLGVSLMKMWALNKTTKTKATIILERNTGKVLFLAEGTGDFPKVKDKDLGTAEKYGIPMEFLKSIKDDRFDS